MDKVPAGDVSNLCLKSNDENKDIHRVSDQDNET
jgi:hypothetical protein